MPAPKRGEVYFVSLDPTLGAEIKKTRPAVIIQNNISNRYSPTTIIAPVTSKFDEELYPTEVPVQPPEGGLTDMSVILLDQIRTVDRRRLVCRVGKLKTRTIARIDNAVVISLGLTGRVN